MSKDQWIRIEPSLAERIVNENRCAKCHKVYPADHNWKQWFSADAWSSEKVKVCEPCDTAYSSCLSFVRDLDNFSK